MVLERIGAERERMVNSDDSRKDRQTEQSKGHGVTGNLPINLQDLSRQRTFEGERVEYEAGSNPLPVLHTICAFANDFHNLGGGYVLLGVGESNGLPVLPPKGIDPERIEAVQNELLRLGQSAIQPPYHPLTGIYEVGGRTILCAVGAGRRDTPV